MASRNVAHRRRAAPALPVLAMVSGLLLGSLLPAGPARALEDLADYVFVANRTSAEIAVIDTAVDRVVTQAVVADIPDQYVLSEAAGKLIASHRASKKLSIFDLRGFRLAQVLELDFDPEQLQLGPEGDRLAVSSGADGVVAWMPLDGSGELRRLAVPDPGYMAFNRRGDLLFVGSRSHGRVHVLDLEGAMLAKEIDLGTNGSGVTYLARTPGALLSFALHGESGVVSVIDLMAQSYMGALQLPGPAVRAFPTADSQFVLIPNESDGSVSKISTWSLKVRKSLPGAAAVSGINTGMFEQIGVVLDREENKARLIDLWSGAALNTLSLPGRPETGITTDAGRKVYVALSGTDRVAVIDLIEQRLAGMIEGVGDEPWAVSSPGGASYCH